MMSIIQFVVFYRINNIPHSLVLEMDKKPSFQSNEYGVISVNAYKNFTDKDEIIKAGANNTIRTNNYYFSTVTIQDNVKFEANSALGAYLESGSGGAIFTCFCKLQANKATFERNVASIGGAICGLASSYWISICTFTSNKAYKLGGAIYLHNGFREESLGAADIQQNFLISECKFNENIAQECGGSLSLDQVNAPYIEKSEFKKNFASLSGGALYAINLDNLKLFNCNFTGNNLSNNKQIHSDNLNKNFRAKNGFGANIRGGGAIFARGLKESQESFNLYTQNCIFKENKFNKSSNIDYNGGHCLMLQGIKWMSVNDCLQIPFETNIAGNYNITRTNEQKSCGNDAETIYSFPKYYTLASPKNLIGLESSTTDLPTPTKFTYYATPLIRNPHRNDEPKPNLEKFSLIHEIKPQTTRTNSPTRSNIPLAITNVPKDFPKATTKILTQMATFTNTFSITNTITTTVQESNGEFYYTFTNAQTTIEIQTITLAETYVVIFDEPAYQKQMDQQKSRRNMIIAIAAACVGLIVVVILIIIFLKKRSTKEESDQSVLSMDSEQVGKYMNTSTTTAVTQENPLWSSELINYDGDDPFKGDFQEQTKEGYFAATNEEMRDVDQD